MLNQPNETDPQAANIPAGESAVEVARAEEEQPQGTPTAEGTLLERAKQVTNRDFTSVDDFLKFVENANSLVGDQAQIELRKKAEAFEALNKNNEVAPSTPEVKPQGTEPSVATLAAEIEEMRFRGDFFKRHPNATEGEFELIKDRSKSRGLSLNDAESQLLNVLAKPTASETPSEGPQLPSNERTVPQKSEEDLMKEAKATRNFAPILRARFPNLGR